LNETRILLRELRRELRRELGCLGAPKKMRRRDGIAFLRRELDRAHRNRRLHATKPSRRQRKLGRGIAIEPSLALALKEDLDLDLLFEVALASFEVLGHRVQPFAEVAQALGLVTDDACHLLALDLELPEALSLLLDHLAERHAATT
jgi:hypothetical protein